MQEQTPSLFSEHMKIVQVTSRTLNTANYLIRHADRYTYLTCIHESRLKYTKYFIGYVGNKPVCLTGFNTHKWGYASRTFSNTCSVIHEKYANSGYMSEMKNRLYTYLEVCGIDEVDVQISHGNRQSILTHNMLGFQMLMNFEGHTFMRLKFNNEE